MNTHKHIYCYIFLYMSILKKCVWSWCLQGLFWDAVPSPPPRTRALIIPVRLRMYLRFLLIMLRILILLIIFLILRILFIQ